jgi:hypothetical protein
MLYEKSGFEYCQPFAGCQPDPAQRTLDPDV